MHFVLFCHSLVSDWNHGNAHFLRGVASELLARGHQVDVYEPEDGWSLRNLREQHGDEPVRDFHRAYPQLRSTSYRLEELDLDAALRKADVVLVNEWNDHELVRRIGEHRAGHEHYRLLFHDTHHRAVTAPEAMARYDLTHYDGVLAFGRIIRDLYRKERHVRRAWTWHEAADVRIFKPLPPRVGQAFQPDADAGGTSHTVSEQSTQDQRRRQAGKPDLRDGDLVWIGNWGDNERTGELHEFLLEPVRQLKLKARVHGVRYPEAGLKALKKAGVEYGGWLPNYRVPEVFARFGATAHIPRRPYRESIPGIPTIRMFEALACGIPLVSVHWEDIEGLFTPGEDYLVAQTGEEMADHLKRLLKNPGLAEELSARGVETIRARHTCGHRVDELLEILQELE